MSLVEQSEPDIIQSGSYKERSQGVKGSGLVTSGSGLCSLQMM